MAKQDVLYAIALTKIPQVGSIIAKNLVSYCGGFEAVFKEKKKNLLKIPGVGLQTANCILSASPENLANIELQFTDKNQIACFTYLDTAYPKRLKQCIDAPILVYYKGCASLNPPRSMAIIGTRQATNYGKLLVEKIIRGLAEFEVQVISGLAYGIDVSAHQCCIQENIDTIGILGHGLDRIYPFSHKSLAEKMLLHGGLLTEFPAKTKPDRENFPMRNRIIAGMSDAVLVIESADSGGSIITAKIANDYNRDVFAIPGRVSDKRSKGCNYLIKANLANLAENVEDIAKFMRWDQLDQKKNIQTSLFEELASTEKKIVEILRDQDSIAIDQIQYIMEMPSSEIAHLILQLEFKGIVKSMPGKRFALL